MQPAPVVRLNDVTFRLRPVSSRLRPFAVIFHSLADSGNFLFFSHWYFFSAVRGLSLVSAKASTRRGNRHVPRPKNCDRLVQPMAKASDRDATRPLQHDLSHWPLAFVVCESSSRRCPHFAASSAYVTSRASEGAVAVVPRGRRRGHGV